MKKKGYTPFDHTKGPYPLSHSIDGEKMPPEGTKQPKHDGGNPPHIASKAFGICNPAGEDFGPLIDHLGEGLFSSFKLDFSNTIPFSTGGIHPHTGLLLFALALNMRPDVIVETGTFMGYSTFYLAKVCETWRQGKVYTFDPDQNMIAPEIKRNPYVECIPARSDSAIFKNKLEELGEIDFAFIDSWKRLALFEFALIADHIVDGGIVVFHDTQLLNTGRELWQIINGSFQEFESIFFSGIPHEDNPHNFHGNADHRGLLVLRKRSEVLPFLEVADAGTDDFGSRQVTPKMEYLSIVPKEIE